MARRTIVLILTMLLALTVAAPAAFGWSNGPDVNGVGNGFGTHDWILDNAIRMAGPEGSWIDSQTALLASDDPDTFRTANEYHLFRDQGIGRGAPAIVADLYYKAVQAYRIGETKKASEYVGLLSHYYGDILQPFHTDYRALGKEAVHLKYELAADDYTRKSGDKPEWRVQRAALPVTDVRAKTVSAAYFSRSKYSALVTALGTSGNFNSTVSSITGQVMSRASNDLADIVRSIPVAAATSTGIALPPAKLTGSAMSVYYPASTGKVRASTTALNAAGKPIEGAIVTFTWPLKAGTKTVKAYTNAAGFAYYWQTLDGLPLMKKVTVGIAASAAGTSTVSSTWFMPTPRLADGSAGIKTTMSNHYPRQYTNVTATTLIRNRAGKPVVGLPVTFSWKHKYKTYTYKTVTNSKGIAKSTRNIGKSTKGYKVYVRAQTQSGGYKRSSTGSFTPK